MRRLTFKGYLERYVRSLSLTNTNSIAKLAGEIKDNHRLREPLFLYALCTGKTGLLLSATKNEPSLTKFSVLASKYTWQTMLASLVSGDSSLDRGYHKTYNSYICRRDMPKTDSRSKALIYNKIKGLQEGKGVTNYRVYTDLHLNAGNVNAFLKTGDTTKVSLCTARRIVQYLEDS